MAHINSDIPIHDKYTEYLPRWEKINDVIDGGAKLQAVDLAEPGTYLHHIQPLDQSQYNVLRNQSYIKGARFYNATDRTLQGLLGMVFRILPQFPEKLGELEYLLADSDGTNLNLNQHIQRSASQVMQIGRHGLLVDMPMRNEDTEITKADVTQGFRPKISSYTAQCIQDWNVSVFGGKPKLTLVILRESKEIFKDASQLSRENFDIFRVLRLREGIYTQQLYSDEGPISDEFSPLRGDGATWDIIPFQFIGSENNDPDIDKLPLESLVDINLGHYQNTADLESSSFQLSAGQPVVSDDQYSRTMNHPDNKKAKNQTYGENTLMVLGSSGKFNIVQVSPNVLANDLRESKEKQMVALGAQLITDGGQAETAEAVRIKKAADVSVLSVLVGNISEAYTQAMIWAGDFLNVTFPENEKVMVNKNFFDTKLTHEDRKNIVAEWQGGVYPHRVALEQLQKGGVVPEDEDIDKLIEETSNELVIGIDNAG